MIGEELEETRRYNNNDDNSSYDDDNDDYDDNDSVDGDELGRIVQSFRAFVDQDETGLQGAEFPR
jgi:hypothetical protein